MGMFDSVYAPCPRCGKMLQFQSKAGECLLRKYKHTDVPAAIAHDLGEEYEDGVPREIEVCCNAQWRLKASIPRVQMKIEEWDENERWD